MLNRFVSKTLLVGLTQLQPKEELTQQRITKMTATLFTAYSTTLSREVIIVQERQMSTDLLK